MRSNPLRYQDWLREVLPPGWTADAPHIRLIAEHLDALLAGEIDRLAIFEPPRHAKTETVSVRLPVRALEQEPHSWFLLTGYNERFAGRLGRKARGVAATRLDLDPKKKSADEWMTLQGGGVMTRGVGSPPTGVGFKGIVIDDPIRRREDADSEAYREKTWDWYTDDLYTRLEPGGWIAMVLTRWHEDDVASRAIASEPNRWTILRLPALAEPDDPLGRAPGEALWPDRFDVDALNRIRTVMARREGDRSFEALYQQNPTPREGSLFLISRLQIVDRVPTGLPSCRGWDLAATGNGGDWTAGVKVSGPDPDGLWYVEAMRFQHEPHERNRLIRLAAQADGPATRVRIPQDPGAAGKESAKSLIAVLAGFPVRASPVTGNKMLRAEPFAAQVNAGNVRVVRNACTQDFIEELRQAPNGKHDDMIDAVSDAFNELAGKRAVELTIY